MWRGGIGLGDYTLYFPYFFHEVQLCRQASSRVCEQDVDTARFCGLNGIENYSGRIAAFLRDDGDVIAFAPSHQLLARGCPERVPSCQHHTFALTLKILGQLADGGGFAGTVDPGDHDHEWFCS